MSQFAFLRDEWGTVFEAASAALLADKTALDEARDREFEVSGMPNEQGVGFVDYVL